MGIRAGNSRDVGPAIEDIDAKRLAEQFGTPLYVYRDAEMKENAQALRERIRYRPTEIYFAAMSNLNPNILAVTRGIGIGIHVASPAELAVAKASGFTVPEIVVTGAGFTPEELAELVGDDVRVNLDSLGQLRCYCDLVRQSACRHSRKAAIRIWPLADDDALLGSSHRDVGLRLGLRLDEAQIAVTEAEAHGLSIVGIHSYFGTNVMSAEAFFSRAESLIRLGEQFPDLEYVDIGGGFGIDYSHRDSFDWESFGPRVSGAMESLSTRHGRSIALLLEPGRSLIASAGWLIARVTDVKARGDRTYVGTDASMSNFLRPYIYGDNHRITVVTRGVSRGDLMKACVCGNTVATGDVLAWDVSMSRVDVGDLVVIHDVGAYGFSMSSQFCGRTRPAEVLIEQDVPRLIRRRETADDLLRNVVWNPTVRVGDA